MLSRTCSAIKSEAKLSRTVTLIKEAPECTLQTSLLLAVQAAASVVKPQISSICNFLKDK